MFCVFEALSLIPLLGNDVLDFMFAAKREIGTEGEEVIGGCMKFLYTGWHKFSKGG